MNGNRILVAGFVAAMALSACSGSTSTTSAASPTSTAGAVTVQLKEFSITPSTTSIAAGQVSFNAENVGGVAHEMVIIRTDDAPDALPTEKDGTANEDAKGLTGFDEVEDIATVASGSLTVGLAPGS
jgi:ABC-type glycerol-3-phosphate transport system substrate-binding protein